MLRVLCQLGLGILDAILDTLPRDESEAGVFVSGFCWAFLIFCVLLVVVTWAWARANGVPV